MATRLTRDDLTRYTTAAQTAKETCDQILSSTEEWQKTAQKKDLPPIERRTALQGAALETFNRFLNVKVDFEDARHQLNARLSAMDSNDDPNLFSKLDTQREILNRACESMDKDLELAKTALNSLSGLGRRNSLADTMNSLLGGTPHLDALVANSRSRSSSMGSNCDLPTSDERKSQISAEEEDQGSRFVQIIMDQ